MSRRAHTAKERQRLPFCVVSVVERLLEEEIEFLVEGWEDPE